MCWQLQFWVKLDWPVAQESDIFKTMLADSICNVGLAYMRGLHAEIKRQVGYPRAGPIAWRQRSWAGSQ